MDSEIVTVGREQDVSIGQAALTMAIGIIVERVNRLPKDDREELSDLINGLADAKDPEEIEAIRIAMREILEQAPSGVRSAISGQTVSRSEKLQNWVNHAAKKVEELRKAAGLTQIQLAEMSGLPQSHISRIESAKLSPSRATLEKIANALGLHVREIDPSA